MYFHIIIHLVKHIEIKIQSIDYTHCLNITLDLWQVPISKSKTHEQCRLQKWIFIFNEEM